ncbi:MAG: class I SAM-dependent methyltransferase [Firmicutes bacterium]|nr:class I SAM-dependent methyltransferase [Bacillota bacterium]
MKSITLSPRLMAVAELVPAGAKLADIGTDHGLLPAFLLQQGKIESAYASDIRPGPLARAVRTARVAGVLGKIRFDLADGLSGLRPFEADCIVIAGMGGETIAEILTQSVDIISKMVDINIKSVNIIIQPMTKAEKLREALGPLGLTIKTERLVLDREKIYPILVCARLPVGRDAVPTAPFTPAELLMGQWELISGDPLFPRYLELQIARQRKARKSIDELLEMQRRISHAGSQ